MRISVADVLQVMDLARKHYTQLPAAASLSGMNRPMSEGERLALSYIQGSLNLANRLGLLRQDLKAGELDLEYDTPDSLVDSDEYESAFVVQPQEPKRRKKP